MKINQPVHARNELLAEANKGIGAYLLFHKAIEALYGANAQKRLEKQQREFEK